MAIGLYIHVPFCIKKCFYCDFTSYLLTFEAADAYLNALSGEIRMYGHTLPHGLREVSSVYIGGGTPTCLPACEIRSVLEKIRSVFSLLPECEVTLEANPGTISQEGLQELAECGVNRLSLGIQSFQDSHLGILGRIHTAGEAVEAIHLARKAGFRNLSLDLIYGIPGQTLEEWLETLSRTVDLSPEHISAYGLQLEEGTPLKRSVEKGEYEKCPEELDLSMYQAAIDFLTDSGYDHYEVSNFARTGKQCAHNLVYWMNQPYLGLGPAAHSCLFGERFSNEPLLERYLDKVARGVLPVEHRSILGAGVEMSETMFLGLRLINGVNLNLFLRRYGFEANEIYRAQITGLIEKGLLEQINGFLRLSKKGLPVANRVFSEFV